MSRALVVLRPEPGNARTAAAIEAGGHVAIRLPLFAVVPLAWQPPDPRDYDALLLTSANAVRHGGPGLDRLRALPVLAVGAATEAAARAAGFRVVATGAGGIDALPDARGRLLHLGARERMTQADLPAIAVYAAEPLPVAPATLAALAGQVALLHSARAARAFAALPLDRAGVRVAALSAAVAAAAGAGWERVAHAARPDDATLVALARTLTD
ncbi:uroporphyrinogen-III synthase [Sphingomonas sp. GC_Shp_6]|uniref:uroporphyrinogen-III synthase n=1 Tax=Sphingomonas sp. GC_Shp_6 TaxID=2937378 RepID=UPI002269FFFB